MTGRVEQVGGVTGTAEQRTSCSDVRRQQKEWREGKGKVRKGELKIWDGKVERPR